MPRPTTKSALLTAAQSQWERMWMLIDSMTLEEQNATFSFDISVDKEAHWRRDKNLRDVLVHLYEWHQLLLVWVEANQSGSKATFLPVPYNWKTYGDMNAAFWKKHQSTPYPRAKAKLCESHTQILALIERFSDKELFEKKRFLWTGTSSLGSYCVSVTASHYDWAMKKIKRHMKKLKAGAQTI